MVITIYGKDGTAKAQVSPGDSSTQTKEVQGDNVLALTFTHYEHIALDVNDYADYEGERYWLMEKYQPTQKSEGEWKYDLKLYGVESLVKRFLVLETTDGQAEPVFTLTAPPREHVAMVVKCVNAALGTEDWKVGEVTGTDNIVIDYEGKYCDEALAEIAEAVGGQAEWWIEGTTVNISRCETGEELTLAYGEGLKGLERDTSNTNKFYTRLFPIGSSRNIDAEKYGHSRLMLPDGKQYVEVGTDEYGIYDHYEADAFADIYPRRVGTVTSVMSKEAKDDDGNAYTIYYFEDSTLDFDPNDYEIAGLVKHVSFQEGSELAGLGTSDDHYFEVNYDSKTKRFEIITIWPYDDETQLPGGQLVPKIGDTYILWNIRMPDEYYTLAEKELAAAVDDYNAEHWQDISIYKGTTDHVWVEQNAVELFVGRRVKLVSAKYFPTDGYRQSRITRLERKVTLPGEVALEISDALQTGALDRVADSVESVRNYTRVVAGGLPDLIKTGDGTEPTDTNVYSARRSHKEFVSKKTDDTVKGFIRFLQGVSVADLAELVGGLSLGQDGAYGVDGSGNAVLSTVELQQLANALATAAANRVLVGGSGFELYMDANGKSHLWVDELMVRMRAYFAQLEIRKISYSGGTTLFSNAGSTIAKVVDYLVTQGGLKYKAYKCYCVADDGTTATSNWWRAGDQALCQTFNVQSGVHEGAQNRYYWRLVLDAGQETLDGKLYDYMVLAGTLNAYIDGKLYVGYDTSTTNDEPQAGDVIVQAGSQTDAAARGNVIMLTTSSEDGTDKSAPSLRMYHGINSYKWTGLTCVISPKEILFNSDYFKFISSDSDAGKTITEMFDESSEAIRTEYEAAIEASASSLKSTISAVESKADKAQTTANNAQTAADNASTEATEATEKAGAAQTAADKAQTAADSAQAAADANAKDISNLENTTSELTKSVSQIEQKADEISMTVTEELLHENMLLGTDFLRVADGWAWNAHTQQLRRILSYGGRNSVYVKCQSGYYEGVKWTNLTLKAGTTYIFHAYYYVPTATSMTIGADLKDSSSTNRKSVRATIAAATDKWTELTMTYTPTADVAGAWLNLWAYGESGACYFSSPFLAEGSAYRGWSCSENDAAYIGGNLLDNADTLAVGGNLTTAANRQEESDGNCSAHNTVEASGSATVLAYQLSVDAATDYILSFWAKRSAGTGTITVNMSDNIAYCEAFGGNVSRYTEEAGASTKSGYVAVGTPDSWQRVWVHFRTIAASTAQNIRIQAENDITLYVTRPKLEAGAAVTDWTTYKETVSTDLYAQLLPTGIDIRHRLIKVTADQFIVQNNSGETTAEVDSNGNLRVHNGVFTGFTLAGETKVAPDNIDKYLSVLVAANGYTSLDFLALGSNPVFSGDIKTWCKTALGSADTYPTVILPTTVAPSSSYSSLATTRAEAVRYVGQRVIIRNESTQTIGVYGGGTMQGGSTSAERAWIGAGRMAVMECKMSYSDTDKGKVYWDGFNVEYDGVAATSEESEAAAISEDSEDSEPSEPSENSATDTTQP